MNSVIELLTTIFRSSTEEQSVAAETALLSHPERDTLFDIAMAIGKHHFGIRTLAARYYTQCFPNAEKTLLLSLQDNVMIRSGVIQGFGELHLVERILPFFSDSSSVVRDYAKEVLKDTLLNHPVQLPEEAAKILYENMWDLYL